MTAPLPCPVQDRCGGCPWMDRDLEAQRQDKVAAVERALDHPVDTVHVSPRTLGYRARITLRSGSDGAWSYSAPRSHDPVAVDHCPIARPELSAALAALPPVAGARAVELRSDGEHVVLSFDGGQRAALDALEGPWVGVARGGKGLWGETRTTLDVAGLSLGFGPATFYQVNLEMNALLVERVGHAVRALAPEAVLELYSGAGNLGLPLAATGVRITSIYPGEVNTPILDERPVPVPDEKKARMVHPEDIASLIVAIAQLPKHVVVPELVIKPTYQEFI